MTDECVEDLYKDLALEVQKTVDEVFNKHQLESLYFPLKLTVRELCAGDLHPRSERVLLSTDEFNCVFCGEPTYFECRVGKETPLSSQLVCPTCLGKLQKARGE